MRALLVFAAIVAPSVAPGIARAEAPRPPVIWKNRVVKAPAGPQAFTQVSHVLYLNDCLPNGCTVSPGNDDSRTNRSSIPESLATLSAYPHGQTHWESLVTCVRETFAPFDIQIVTQDPGTASHFEVMVGGSSEQLHPQLQAGGVAPFISCGATDNNVISFVFPETTANLNFLCAAVAQEASHVWGLDHELNAKDPMTYLDLTGVKRFQNDNAQCGEDLGSPRECYCGGPRQNSFQYMADSFGPANLEPPTVAITSPVEGQWVKPGFAVRAELMSQLSAQTGALSIDGTQAAGISAPFVWNTPATLAGGAHTIAVSVTDAGQRTAMASVGVNVTASCSATTSCADGFHCLGGFCLPGNDVAGGLGATCTTNEQCITGTCGSDGTDSLCTGPCDEGNSCPSGFSCRSDGAACWPSEDDGGCAATSGGSPLFLLATIGVVALAGRRRRRAARSI